MTILKAGTNGTAGTNGASPTPGTAGGSGVFTQNGMIGADSIDVLATGGLGGAGGNGVAVPGANGGDGGLASITLNGNIFNAPAATTVAVHLVANGGNGGAGGTGTTNGTQGKGGNATITASGNIFQPNKILTSIEIDAFSTGGTGSTPGNATSTINGNIFQTSKAVGTVTLAAAASGGGTNAATLNGNIVQGNINNVNLAADTIKGTAAINGNIVQTNATNTGLVTLEASGSHISITNNKFTLGTQELDFAINSTSPYDVSITGNTLKGSGANIFKFSDIATPGPLTDSVSINLASQTLVFDGQASNAISGFGTLVGLGNAFYTFVGDDNANTLTGAGLNDTFTGGKGNDFINGNGGIDTAIYTGNHTDYTIVHDASGNGTVTDTIANRDGMDTLTSIEKLQFADGTYNFLTGVFTGINHAPVLDALKSPALATETTNAPAPVGAVGTLVSSLVDFAVPAGQVDNVTDVDPGALLGIALTGANTTNGSWWYSTNNGANWTALPVVSDSSALLLAADSNTRLYFQPTAAYTGSDPAAITFRAWDQTTGANGQTGINASINGGSTAFSTANDTASLTISNAPPPPVNAPPTATNLNAAETYIEDQTLNLTDIVASDVDSPNVTATLTLSAIAAGALTTATSGAVTSTFAGGVWTASGAIADVNTLLAGVSFVPAANYNGNFTIATKVDDGAGGIVTGTKNITGTPVNDAPVATPATVTMLEDNTHVFTVADFGFSDPTDAASASGANNLSNIIINAAPGAGTLTYNNVAIGVYPFTVAAANIGLLKFTPAANANGNAYASISYKLQDDGGTANFGVDTSALASLTINVTSVNDAPTSSNLPLTMLEDGSHTFTVGDFGFSDAADAPAPNNLMNIIITGAPANGTLTYNNAPIGAYPLTIAAANIGLLKYAPAANANGAGYASIGYKLQDDGTTANGGSDTSVPYTMTVNVTAVNDAPVATPATVTMLEDNTHVFTVADFGFSDPTDAASASGANNLANIIINAAPASGTLTYNNLPIGGYPLTIAAGNIGLLKFTPAANANGNAYTSISYKLQDDGTTANGGSDTSALASLTINVTPVNDAPVANNDSYVTGQNTALVVPQAIGVIANDTDVDGDTLSVSFITTPSHGSLGMNANGAFTYTPTAGFTGVDTFTYQATDGALSSNTATVTITVDGAPVAVDDSYSTGLNTPLVINAAMGVQANDSDPESDPLTSAIVVGPAHGSLGAGLNADGSFTYTPNPGYTGPDSFTYRDNDGALNSNTATVNINVASGENYFGTSGNDTHTGTAFDDVMHVSAGNDTLNGAGNTAVGDTITFDTATAGVTVTLNDAAPVSYTTAAGAGTTLMTNFENLTGSSFDDLLTGDNNTNVINGGDGNDVLFATPGGDTLNGGNGNDTADFSLNGGPGGVTVSLATAGVQAVGGSIGNITLTGIENLTGSTFSDTLQGNSGDNILDGGAGGVDTADYSNATANGLVVNLVMGTATGGGVGNDTLLNIANVTGSGFNDTLIGDDNSNNLNGGAGNDILFGHGGNNTLDGGASGTDVAYYAGLETDHTVFTDFFTGAYTGVQGMTENDSLSNIARLKFLAPSHVSDVNGDGVGDQVFFNSTTGQIAVNGSTLTNTIPLTSRVVGTGQFNPDELVAGFGTPVARDSGILVQNNDGTLAVLYDINGVNSTATNFSSAGALTGTNYNSNWKAIATGDFNGDASADVLLQNQATKALEIFTVKANTGDAVGFVNSVTSVTGPAGTSWKPVATGDFNGDGKSDILFQNTASKAIEIYEMNGGAVINTPVAQAASGLTAIGTGDFNNDGGSDILFTNASGQAVIWLMNGDSHVGTKTVAKPAGYTVSGIQDVDGNGYSDIVWTNGTNNVATTFSSPSSLTTTTVMMPASPLAATPGGFAMVASTGGG